MCNPLKFHLLAEIQHEVILFCSGQCSKQSIEIYDRRTRTRLNHPLKEDNSIILLLDTNNPTTQSLSVTREISIAGEALYAEEEVVWALEESSISQSTCLS